MTTTTGQDAEADTQAGCDLVDRGRIGSVFYLPVWLLIALSGGLPQGAPGATWGGAMLLGVFGAMRFACGLRYRRDEANRRLWLSGYRLAVLALGLCWGTLCAYLVWSAPFAWSSYLVSLATAGLVAGGTISLNCDLALLRGYAFSMLLPGTAAWLVPGTPEGLVMGALGGLFLVFMLLLGRQSNGEYWAARNATRLLEERAAQLEQARARAEAADHAKSRFLASMSHEIRTPLNGVFGMIELLKSGDDATTRASHLAVLEHSAHALLGIIDDILDLSKIEAGKLTLERSAFVPSQLAAEICQLFAENARAKGLRLAMSVAPGIDGATFAGDPLRVRQVLSNLVSNAIKFTTSGEVLLGIEALEEGEHRVRLRFSVRDTGLGIPAQALQRIFEPFEQADNSITRQHGGTGLGLAICSRLVAMMDGEITVESRPRDGSCFRVDLPFERAKRIETPSALDAPRRAAFAGLRVLVAEDNPVNRTIAEAYLDKLGCEAELVDGGLPAVEAVHRSHYDLVLMDCEMPDLDGFQATRRIRALEMSGQREPVVIVALTAHALGEHRQLAREAGMDDFLSKPYTLEQLRGLLRTLAAPRRARPAPVPAPLHDSA